MGDKTAKPRNSSKELYAACLIAIISMKNADSLLVCPMLDGNGFCWFEYIGEIMIKCM